MSKIDKDQRMKIVEFWGKYGDITKVRREYVLFYGLEKHPRDVPYKKAFKRIVDHWLAEGSVHYKHPFHPKTVRVEENIQRVRNLVAEDMSWSVRDMAKLLDLPRTIVWEILRKDMRHFPYKSKSVNHLDDDHKKARVKFCEWLLQQPSSFVDRVIWTDEKVFELRCRANRQNERYWAPLGQDPCVEDEVRVQGGPKLCCWGMIVDGVVSLFWYEKGATVNRFTYLDTLQTFMVPNIEARERGDQYWFQQVDSVMLKP